MDPSNNHSGIRVGSSESCSLLRTANDSSTKQCEELESNSATNGRALLEMAVEVREKRKEFGVREVVRNPVLSRSNEPPTSFGGVGSCQSRLTRVGMRPMTRIGKYV